MSRNRLVKKRGMTMKSMQMLGENKPYIEPEAELFRNNPPPPCLVTETRGTQINPRKKGRRGREYTQDTVHISPLINTLPKYTSIIGRKPLNRNKSMRPTGAQRGEVESTRSLGLPGTK